MSDPRTTPAVTALGSGTLAGSGAFRCEQCGYVVSSGGVGELGACPGCGAEAFVRASLFTAGRFQRAPTDDVPAGQARETLVDAARELLDAPGTYLAYEGPDGRPQVVALAREWTRIGRSLAADVRFDDPTVSRRHALIVRQADGVRVVDDRSLNGVFVNGKRVEWQVLRDGDELVVGRYHLHVLEHAGDRAAHGVR
ncbi:FHA domain-containing protein [Conexibacter sp. SYSU D00693]|uniref:FHA domain-containing protein n=1 Tax=Conexibacter sp. SYSU D00693 TaxID=2812560 RepID=UPI00196A29F5|nr:FHA domain-containing protein [Conexibacter sp. SYSU D00693]